MVARPRAGQETLGLDVPAAPELAQLSLWDEMVLDFSTQGLSTRAHPVELLRPLLPSGTVELGRLTELRHNQLVQVVGAVVARQQPGTAKGMVFMLLEDGTGTANVIVNPQLYARERLNVRSEAILRVGGRLERHGDVLNLVATTVRKLPRELRGRAPRKLQGKMFC
jgi:error-prone DNA polymerase